MAAALLTSEDEDFDLSKIKPEDIFNKLFLKPLPKEPEGQQIKLYFYSMRETFYLIKIQVNKSFV